MPYIDDTLNKDRVDEFIRLITSKKNGRYVMNLDGEDTVFPNAKFAASILKDASWNPANMQKSSEEPWVFSEKKVIILLFSIIRIHSSGPNNTPTPHRTLSVAARALDRMKHLRTRSRYVPVAISPVTR
jgi:hypothetical protein